VPSEIGVRLASTLKEAALEPQETISYNVPACTRDDVEAFAVHSESGGRRSSGWRLK
jgi:hypothetical protein